MGISKLLLPDTQRTVRESQVHRLRSRMDCPLETRNFKHPMVDSNPLDLGFQNALKHMKESSGMKAASGGYEGVRERGGMLIFNEILAFFANEAHTRFGCRESMHPIYSSSMSSSGYIPPPPCLFMSNRLLPYYEAYFLYDNSTRRMDFDISHCFIVGYCSVTGWILMVFGRRVGYYSIRTLETLYLPDLEEDINHNLENDINYGIFGGFSTSPDDEYNVTMLVTHSILTLIIYRHSRSVGNWIRDTISIEPQIARAHIKTGGDFFWVNELTGTLNRLSDWALRSELEVESVELGDNFSNCLMISSVVGNARNNLTFVTCSYDFKFSVYNVAMQPLGGVEIIQWSNLGGKNYYVVSNGTRFSAQSVESSNMLYVASLWEDDCIQLKIDDGVDQVMEQVKTCPHQVDERCKCRAAWINLLTGL